MPRLSIIVPIYNSVLYLQECVDSVLSQTYRDFEIILVDDGSTDGSADLCDELQNKDSRIRVVHKANGGAASARNVGLDMAQGELIGFVDADDLIHPQMYEILMQIMYATGADISRCYYKFIDEDEGVQFAEVVQPALADIAIEECDVLLNSFDKHCRRVSLISPCMRLCKASLFENLRFEEGYIEEDSMLLLPLLAKANKIASIDIPFYFWRSNPQSVTRVAFNPKRFAFIKVSHMRVQFFEKRGDVGLAKIFRREYMNRVVAFYLRAEECGFLSQYADYLKMYRANFWHYVFKSGMCKSELLMHFGFYFHVPIWRKIYSRLRPVDAVYLK